MKQSILFLLVLLTSIAVQAGDLTGIKIYVNPGHGGHDAANDRNIVTIPFEANDPNGYWESNSNLAKGLALRDLLENAGATVIISRTQNRDEDDRALSEIVAESNANNVDAFLSIHSNAGGTLTNYALMLYAGVDPGDAWTYPTPTPCSDESRALSTVIGSNIISNQLTVWTSSATAVRGDKSFGRLSMLPAWDDGYGVLRGLTTPGLISEGEFHEYKPEAHRLLNRDYCALEACQFYRSFCTYFQKPQATTGVIAGYVKSGNEIINNPRYAYIPNSQDQWLPLNGATVELFDAAGQNKLDSYTIDNWYNGVFVFYNLTPGNYKLKFSAPLHETKTAEVTVTAAQTVYSKMQLKNLRISVPDYPDPDQSGGIMALNHYDFETVDGIANPDWLKDNAIKRVLYRNDKLYVLTTEPKILIINAKTVELIKALDLTGTENLCDIAFTADNFLLACNRETIAFDNPSAYFKVYTWDDDDSAPRLLFQSQKNGNWTNGIIGETFAVSGSRWNCKIYTTAISTSSPVDYRIVGFQYNEDAADIVSKYRMDANIYTVALWGDHPIFTLSPNGNGDNILIDSDVMLPVEYQFDWTKADREPMVKIAGFAEASNYVLPAKAAGGNFFRNAKHTYFIMPVCESDGSKVGAVLFDVNDGLDKAVKVSEKYPAEGLGETLADYMMASGIVKDNEIDLLILAKNQGIAHYKTVEIPTANIYASGLLITSGNDFQFTLNEDAQSVSISIRKEGETIMSYDAGALQKGTHVISNPFQNMEFDAWSISAMARPMSRPVKLTGNDAVLQFFSLRGVTIDNNPASPFFGRAYMTEGVGGEATGRTTQKGVYILSPLWKDAIGQGANAYNGNVAWYSSASSPFRIKAAPDGYVYITDWSDSPSSGVWVMNPANPGADFRPVFGGSTTDNRGIISENGIGIHGSIPDCWITGLGENTQLYTVDEDLGSTGVSGDIYRYDIGKRENPWLTAPSARTYNDAANGDLQRNGNSSLAPDGQGGWWLSQYRSSGNDAATIPSLIHINTNTANGTVDFNSGKVSGLIGASEQGGMAVTVDGSRIAIGMNNRVKIYDISFDAQGIPSLTQTYVIDHNGGSTWSLAFDVADNLYIALNKSLSVWAVPKINNNYTTYASLGNNTGIQLVKPVEANIYPNPVVSELIISGNNLKSYTIYDLTGRAIRSGKVNNGSQYSVSAKGLDAGVYLIQIATNEGTTVKRFIKK